MFNNKLFYMNYKNRNTLRVLQLWGSACFQQLENYQRRSPFRLSGGTRSRGVKNASGLAPIR